jgi:hypothetical protein
MPPTLAVGLLARARGPPERVIKVPPELNPCEVVFDESPEMGGFLTNPEKQVKSFDPLKRPLGCARAIYYPIATFPQ